MPRADRLDVRLGAAAGARGAASARSTSRPTLLEKARVAVSPGVGFGPGGEGFVRFALVEPDDRARQACAAIGAYLQSR